jgi:hypothetical protein
MNEQNELVPANAGDRDNASSGNVNDDAYDHSEPGTMSREEISAAINRIAALMMAGLMKESLGRAVLQCLKLQLDCSRAPASTDQSGPGGEASSELASFLADNPDTFAKVSPGLAPEFTEAVLRELRNKSGR